MKILPRILIAFAPLAATPGLLWLIGEDLLSFGGGEKDVVVLIPWMLWSIAFAVAFLLETRRCRGLLQPLLRGAGWALGMILVIWAVLYVITYR